MVRNKDQAGEGAVYIVWPKNNCLITIYATLIVMEMMQKGNIDKLSSFPIPLKHNDYLYPRETTISRFRGMLDLI